MNTRTLFAGGVVALSSLSFAFVTGNPFADGWTKGGHSFQNGTFIRGDGLFSYDTYAHTFTVQAGSNLEISDGATSWLAGDKIIGIGGIFVTPPSAIDNGWASYSSNSYNTNLTTSLRMVSKFGTSPTAWSASTTAPAGGNGANSFSGGAGGVGAYLMGNDPYDVVGIAGGTLSLATTSQIYTGSGTVNVSNRVSRYIFQETSADIVTSWQSLLNVSLLERQVGFVYGDLPQFGDRHNVAVQRGTGVTHDALAPVPEPATMTVLALGALAVLRRKHAKKA